MTIGGDHTIPYGPVRACAEKYGPVSLIHFDSHQDSSPSQKTPEGKKNHVYYVPEEVEGIGEYAFRNCSSLSEIRFDDFVDSVYEKAFSDAPSLESINVISEKRIIDEGEEWKEREDSYFSYDGVLFRKYSKEVALIKYPEGKEGEVYIVPDFVKIISNYAFYGSTYLKSVIVMEQVNEIKDFAFESKLQNQLAIYVPADSFAEQFARERQLEYYRL